MEFSQNERPLAPGELSAAERHAIDWLVAHSSLNTWDAVEVITGGPFNPPLIQRQVIVGYGGRSERFDLLLTVRNPAITLVEMATNLGVPIRPENYQPPPPPPGISPSPVGAAVSSEPGLYYPSATDQEPVGTVVTEARGRFLKIRRWWAFVPIDRWKPIE